ncbi:hypothetical protein AYO20_06369 [Fonsecaea nubica]|uniref:Altered inheritance of mitochondria protein 9, mitochondrial n=1 Tax=Fonsecaea nubica TaxID=856822 RepID=A0A178CXX7_9EURO|nr:hypothetical protein AYO20_06369 [Fonsecaea nubica]OAL34316.1 hypothetical protein AYO20_06369 [Fonsecaea nubica]
MSSYGNLYFATDAFPGCEKAEIDGNALQSEREETAKRFVIGPVVDTQFWSQGRDAIDVDRGPWKKPEDYLKAIGHREFSWIRQYATPKPSHGPFSVPGAQNTPSSHVALYEKFLAVADSLLPKRQDLVRPTLWHWDIHAPNLFVHDGKVTSLIDWQDVWAGPLLLQARHPRLIRYDGEVILKLPEHYDALVDKEEKARIRSQVESSLVLWVYESQTKKHNPILHELSQLPQWRTIRDTVELASNTWDGDILPFRQCLIRIAHHWEEINSQVPCPINFTEDELDAHHRDGDGWTSNETYDQALKMFAQLRDQGLQHLTGEERREFEQQTRDKMDDSGPLYNVRMKRGQGYNSYIQEVRIDNAVTITRFPENPARTSASISEADTLAPEHTRSDSVSKAAPASAPKPPLEMNDILATLTESLKKTSAPESPQQPKLPYLLKLDPNARHNQTVTFSSKQVKSIVEMNNAMGFNASAAIKATSLGPGAEARSSLATRDDLNTNDVNFLVHVKVVNEADDRKEEWSFNEVPGLNEALGEDKEPGVMKDAHSRSVEFTRIYGDCFISDFVEGGEIYAWVGIKSQDRKNSRQLAVHASAQLTPMGLPVQASGEMDASQERNRLFSQATTSIRIQWRGGGQIKNHDFPWGMDSLILIANAFPSMVAAKPAKIRAVLTPYTALKSFHDHRLSNPRIPLPLTYDHCAIYTSTLYEDFMAFQDLCEKLNTMIKDPQDFRNRDDDKASKDIQKAALQSGDAIATTRRPTIDFGPSEMDDPTSEAWTDKKTRALMNLDVILRDPTPKLTSMDPDPQKLSMMRLLCRSSMIYIQEQAAGLVVDPARSITKHDDQGRHVYSLPKYICPGVIQSILPIPKFDNSGSEWRDKEIADLQGVEHIRNDPLNYSWDVIGEPLSPYKSYEHFAVGNFDLDDEEYPQRVAVQPFTAGWCHSRRIRDSHNAISGIGLGYANKKAVCHRNCKSVEVEESGGVRNASAEERATMFANMYVGCKPAGDRWKQIEDRSLSASSINRVNVYYRPGANCIAGIELLSDPNPADFNDDSKRVTPVFIHKAWDPDATAQSSVTAKLPDKMDIQALYPGDNVLDENMDKNWMFAGLMGAFEKVGPPGMGRFKTGRVLVKVAVVWKKRPGVS